MISAPEALQRLKAGNQRFVEQRSEIRVLDRAALLAGQQPFAIVIGCSDSRAPVEPIFDQGFGDLFVVRVAGNIVSPTQIGSVEFAAEHFGSRLVVVLGHSGCGAVAATLANLQHPAESGLDNLPSIVECIAPAISALAQDPSGRDPDQLLAAAIRQNVRAQVTCLTDQSRALSTMVEHDGLVIVGAEYALATGEVTFLDE
ncbi:MAG: carbonic anhydrase [Pseudomonadota bacterium]